MRKSLKIKVAAVGATFAMAGALAIVSSGTTNAFFSETKTGGITGTLGAVHLSTTETTFAWTNMMPGEQQSARVNYTNTGTGPEDFYIVFNNRPALHALNNLGTYGEVHVSSMTNGGPVLNLFDSMNLQDGRHDTSSTPAGSNSCGDVFKLTPVPGDGCWPLPTSLPIGRGVAVGNSGWVTFTFNYASKLGSARATNPASSGGGVFNVFPLTALTDSNDPLDSAGAPSNGLPFQIVATQVGQTP